MKIFDCFSYWDENLLLELRFNLLNDHVDHFVIVESDKTWQNNSKKLKFDINKFSQFKKKIIYVPVTDMPDGPNPWTREHYQRNCIARGLINADENDLIIISDIDEFPNPKKISEFDSKLKFAAFKQKHFYYKFNMLNKNDPFWIGSRVCVKKYLKSPQWLRGLKFKKRPFWRIDKLKLNNIIEHGGWHFCNLKTPKNLLYKYQNMCETNDEFIFKNKIDEKYLNEEEISKNIREGKDIMGREDVYEKIDLDETFPSYILENKNLFKEWIA